MIGSQHILNMRYLRKSAPSMIYGSWIPQGISHVRDGMGLSPVDPPPLPSRHIFWQTVQCHTPCPKNPRISIHPLPTSPWVSSCTCAAYVLVAGDAIIIMKGGGALLSCPTPHCHGFGMQCMEAGQCGHWQVEGYRRLVCVVTGESIGNVCSFCTA